MSSIDIAFRISGRGHQTPGFETLLRQAWGYSAIRDGHDYVVLAGDPALNMPPKSVLRLHGPLSLANSNRHKLAGKLFSWIPVEINPYLAEQSELVTVDYDENSMLNKTYACRSRLAGCPQNQIRTIVRDELLPLMSKMGATAVYGVTVDVNYQQSIYTSVKFGFLLKDHELPTVEKLIERRALGGILPSGLNPMWYLDAITRLAPIAATLPIERGNCSWHFIAPSGFFFKHAVFCEGLFQQFMGAISPLAEAHLLLSAGVTKNIMTSAPDSFLKIAMTAVNNAMSFVNDMRNFIVDPDKTIDFTKQIQAFGALDLLFSDVGSLNHATSGYHRINCSINVLDKLANFIKHVGDKPDKESAIFKHLLSMQRCEICCAICNDHVVASEIRDALIKAIRDAYASMHEHCKKELGIDTKEEQILERLYQQRNLRHGTFLRGDQFESIFGQSEGMVPDEIMTIAVMLTLTLALSPKDFLRLET